MRSYRFTFVLTLSLIAGGCGLAYTVPTDAMEPNISRRDLCIANPFAYGGSNIERFDIVVFEMPDSEKRLYDVKGRSRQIKRVVGMPGEIVELRNNRVFVNDGLLEEPFQKLVSESDRRKDFGPITVPDGEYFLLGDNRPESSDSRNFEHPTVKRSDIYSKITDVKKDYDSADK